MRSPTPSSFHDDGEIQAIATLSGDREEEMPTFAVP